MRDLIYKIELAMFETALNPRNPLEDYHAKMKALQDLQMDPVATSDPEIKNAIMQRRADLEKEARAKGIKTEMAEDFNAEYDDEAGMADNNLETMKRAVQGLDDLIQEGDNLPEWCQEKIAVAKSMLVAVWDYMQSENSVGESAPKGWEGTVKAMKKHKEIDNPWALAHYMKNKGYKSHKKD